MWEKGRILRKKLAGAIHHTYNESELIPTTTTVTDQYQLIDRDTTWKTFRQVRRRVLLHEMDMFLGGWSKGGVEIRNA
jgi:hypothetical protein